MSYRRDVTELARSLAALLTAPPPPADATGGGLAGSLSPDAGWRAALTCRDAVVGQLRGAAGALLQQSSPALLAAPDLLTRSPAHALHAALQDLPAATGRDLTLADALATPGGPATHGWQRAARAALALETYHQQLAALPGPQAWSTARDLAALSQALPDLDRDLADHLPTPPSAPRPDPGGLERARQALLEPTSHALLQLAAAELAVHTRDVPAATATITAPVRTPPQPVRRLDQLTDGTRQLTDLVTRRGPHLTAAETRAALRALTLGLDLTARALPDPPTGTPTAPPHTDHVDGAGGDTDPARSCPAGGGPAAVAAQLRSATVDLQQLLHGQLATLTPPAPAVLHLSEQLRGQLGAAGKLLGWLQAHPTGPGRAEDRAVLSQALTRWALTAAPLTRSVRDGLHSAAATGNLLTVRTDTRRSPHPQLLWLPVNRFADPLLHTADRASHTLTGATAALSALLPDPPGPQPATSRAAGEANAAFHQLRAALHTRPSPPLPHPARAPHPTQSPDPARRRTQQH